MKPRERIPVRVCRIEDIVPDAGVCALVGGEQVAVFRVEDKVYAVGNRDPFSGANVLSRGIVGDLKGELVVASPVYKQHFNLVTGRCLEDGAVRLPVYGARVEDGFVVVEPRYELATSCCDCGVGCGVIASVSNNEVTAVRGDTSHPANFGQLCTKGLSLHKADASYRALTPEIGDRRGRHPLRSPLSDLRSRQATAYNSVTSRPAGRLMSRNSSSRSIGSSRSSRSIWPWRPRVWTSLDSSSSR